MVTGRKGARGSPLGSRCYSGAGRGLVEEWELGFSWKRPSRRLEQASSVTDPWVPEQPARPQLFPLPPDS